MGAADCAGSIASHERTSKCPRGLTSGNNVVRCAGQRAPSWSVAMEAANGRCAPSGALASMSFAASANRA
jgi:hypothetical protein